jgi:hypothetical protein
MSVTYEQVFRTLGGMNGQLSIDDVVGTVRVNVGAGGSEPPPAPADVEIGRLRGQGLGWTAVARSLNARGIPTPSGRGQWWPSSAMRHTSPHRDAWAAYMRAYRGGGW